MDEQRSFEQFLIRLIDKGNNLAERMARDIVTTTGSFVLTAKLLSIDLSRAFPGLQIEVAHRSEVPDFRVRLHQEEDLLLDYLLTEEVIEDSWMSYSQRYLVIWNIIMENARAALVKSQA